MDPQGELLAILRGLAPGQTVVLRIGEKEGLWRRFQKSKDGKHPEALNCADDKAKEIWSAIPSDGSSVEVALVRKLPMTATPLAQRSKIRRATKYADIAFTHAARRLDGDVLCIGIDIAWWGGQAGPNKKQTRSECLAIARRLKGAWSDLEILRIDLTERDNPGAGDFVANADVDADLLVTRIRDVLSDFETIPSAVIAGDVPMMAINRPELPQPNKKKERRPKDVKSNVVEYRQCDLKWQIERGNSPSPWRKFPILPGAPLYPQVEKLMSSGLQS